MTFLKAMVNRRACFSSPLCQIVTAADFFAFTVFSGTMDGI